ncbi:MAG: O-antigen ligase family protein [Acidimicrobiales bacterium]
MAVSVAAARGPAESREAGWYLGAALVAPVLIIVAPDYLLVLAVAAMVVFRLIRGHAGPQATRFASNDLMVTGVAFALAGLWSGLAGHGGFGAAAEIARFALVPIGFAVVRGSARVDLRPAIWLGAVLGSIAAGGLAVLMLVIAEVGRPTSYVNPIHFGEMALVLGFIAAITRGLAVGNRRNIDRWTFVAILASLVAAVLSHARGGWVALPAILIVTAIHHYRSPNQRLARYLAVLVLVLTPVMAIAVTANDRAALRAFDRGVSETVEYMVNHGADESGSTSVGARFEMWRSAFAGFRQSPTLGIGWGNMDDRFAEDVDAGVRAERIAEHDHPHNQYLSHLGSGGIVGLITLLALLAVPGWICLRSFLRRQDDVRALGGAGLVVVVGYAVFSLTDSVFETASPLVFYVLAVGAIVAQIDRLENEHVFAYGHGDGMEQPRRPVEGPRADAL